jgi:hypothetical protein
MLSSGLSEDTSLTTLAAWTHCCEQVQAIRPNPLGGYRTGSLICYKVRHDGSANWQLNVSIQAISKIVGCVLDK